MRSYLELIQGRYRKLVDKHLTHNLLQGTRRIDIHGSQLIFLFSDTGSHFYEKLYTLLARELTERGYACCFLFQHDLLNRYFSELAIRGERISNSLSVKTPKLTITNGKERSLRFSWSVEPAKERIETQGLNIFPLVRSTLGVVCRRYNLHFTDKDVLSACDEIVRTCDLLFQYFMLLKEYAAAHNVKIRIVGRESNHVPNGLFRMLCDHFSENGDIEYLDAARGYMHYFGHDFRESYITAVNFTRSKVKTRHTISRNELEQDTQSGADKNEVFTSVSKVLKEQYNHSPSERKGNILEMIEKYLSQNRKIFVLFPHLFYDRPIYDDSPCFKDMCEWIEKTVNFFRNSEDLLLLKPHPAEVRKDEPRKEPNETLASFLGHTIDANKNIVLLEPRLFTVKELYPYISCGLIWRSSVGMELTCLKVPCIIAGIPHYTALDLIYAKNKSHYFGLLERAQDLRVTEGQALNAAQYIYCMEHRHIHIDCVHYDMSSGKYYWKAKYIQQYLSKGDNKLNVLIDRICD